MKARVARCAPADSRRGQPGFVAVSGKTSEDVVINHAPSMPIGTLRSSAYRHVANDVSVTIQTATMGDFRDAFLWHVEKHGTSFAELVAATGVSRDILNKLKARPASSTNVEAGIAIARFYGKTVEQFMRREPSDREREFARLYAELTPQERQLLVAQMRGILEAHQKADE